MSTSVESAHLNASPSWSDFGALASRVVVWGGFFTVLYLLRSFSLLMFLTFVFAYLQAHGVNILKKRLKVRPLCVAIVGLGFLGILIGIGAYIIPNVVNQAKLFADKLPEYLQTSDDTIRALAIDYPLLGEHLSKLESEESNAGQEAFLTSRIVQSFFEDASTERGSGASLGLGEAVVLLRNTGQALFGVGSAFFLALLFSILIVFDLPRLKRGVLGLRETRARWVYDEVADSIREFAAVLGRALEAQLVIAIINTALTAVVVHILGLGDKTAFLSLIVFLCSFIPVAGVFISSIPICFSVLPISGIAGVFLAIGLIWVIHMIEAYVLNPRIFGHHLHINPVLVLIILTVSGKLFHVWGLILSLPICTYIYEHALKPENLEHKAILKKRHYQKKLAEESVE